MLREDDHAPAQPAEDSERSRLDPFVVATGDAPPRDQRDLMERPFFSLAKTPRTKPILYKTADIEVQVFGMPEHGMVTIWDADVLICPRFFTSRMPHALSDDQRFTRTSRMCAAS